MPTPPKPVSVLRLEGKSHRTKAELEQRAAAEDALLTGVSMREWPEVKADPLAHKEFVRVRRLLKKIGKDDALHEGVINRYALLRSECVGFEEKREQFYESKKELQEEYLAGQCGDPDDGGMKPSEYYRLLTTMQNNIVALDRQIQAKRKMLLDIEKENIMTIASALRSIPKTPEKKQNSALADFMERRQKKV